LILADTSVWVDHLRRGDPDLVRLLEKGRILTHPFVIGELACGNLARRSEFLENLTILPAAIEATHEEVMTLLAGHKLWGQGVGWADAHLLASTRLTEARIYTRDGALRRAAEKLGVAYL
jgi:predicted nucleic acid-binding protein